MFNKKKSWAPKKNKDTGPSFMDKKIEYMRDDPKVFQWVEPDFLEWDELGEEQDIVQDPMEMHEEPVRNKLVRRRIISLDGRMSMDNMIAASHLLSMSQNGRAFGLEKYPAIVQRYVEQVLEADAVDENLKKLNQKIVDKLSETPGKYE